MLCCPNEISPPTFHFFYTLCDFFTPSVHYNAPCRRGSTHNKYRQSPISNTKTLIGTLLCEKSICSLMNHCFLFPWMNFVMSNDENTDLLNNNIIIKDLKKGQKLHRCTRWIEKTLQMCKKWHFSNLITCLLKQTAPKGKKVIIYFSCLNFLYLNILKCTSI